MNILAVERAKKIEQRPGIALFQKEKYIHVDAQNERA
jgi:hypothetical protein